MPVVAKMTKLNADQIRKSHPNTAKKQINSINRNPIVLVLDNVLDTYNIGSFFRLADAIGALAIYICGPAVTPPNIKIHRSSIGTWKWIHWQHYQNTIDCINNLKKQNYFIVSCELTKSSILYNKAKYKTPLALVAGNESIGINPEVLKSSDLIVKIPMHGINKSLNTLTATSIIAYQVLSAIHNTIN